MKKKTAAATNLPSRGLWIALFGPDGVGKSAVIEELEAQVGAGFSGVTAFHFRPMFRSKRGSQIPVTNPHARAPRSCLVSALKLIYWLVDCWWGYLFVVRPSIRGSKLVIFDRYYPDILVDPLRYRLPDSVCAPARWLAALVPQPDLRILLDAPVEVLQRRKSEVSLAESQRQRHAYLEMFQALPGSLLVNTECPVDEAAKQISTVIDRSTNIPIERPDSLVITNS